MEAHVGLSVGGLLDGAFDSITAEVADNTKVIDSIKKCLCGVSVKRNGI
jgi:hypothetical protein